jgi:hypothetical protein
VVAVVAAVVATQINRASVPRANGSALNSAAGSPWRAPQLAAPVRPAFTIPAPRNLGPAPHTAVWAPVREAVTARTHAGQGRGVARLSTRTPEGTTNIVTVLGRVMTPHRGLWIRVGLAVLPNGTTGWVPRAALGGYGVVDTRLIVDRRTLTATLLRAGHPIFHAAVGIGAPSTPTPAGQFYVRDELTRYRSPTYGPLAFGTSDRSTTLTDWPAGGYVGIHGTDQPWLLPGRVSHGCIRMRNADILRLGRLMPIGTPVTIL